MQRSFFVGDTEIIATIAGTYCPAEPDVNVYERVEDVRIVSLRPYGSDFDVPNLECPEWLERTLLQDGEADAELIAEACEPLDDPPEQDDRE